MHLDTFVPAYLPLERLRVPRPIDRLLFVKEQCKGKIVIDLGAMDETAYRAKVGRGTWLHEELATVASQVVGIDRSVLVPPGGLRTSENAVIYPGDIMDLDAWFHGNDLHPDVLVAGEIIEHLENPLMFLKAIKAIDRLKGKTLILTTPNATAIHNVIVGMFGRESTHHDHLCILSYKTLCTLCLRAGFESWLVTPYYSRFTEMKERNTGMRRRLVAMGERGINCLERVFPLLSFGYVLTVEI
jgi:hypothetical protein